MRLSTLDKLVNILQEICVSKLSQNHHSFTKQLRRDMELLTTVQIFTLKHLESNTTILVQHGIILKICIILVLAKFIDFLISYYILYNLT